MVDENLICPGCGEDFGQDGGGLADHINDCDHPLEERLTFEIELRKLKEPDGVERNIEYRDGSFAFLGDGAFVPCRYGVRFKVGKGPEDCKAVYYIKHSDLLWAFLKAAERAGVK